MFRTHKGLLVATDYVRLVRGGRGNYIEFDKSHIVWDAFDVPRSEEYRLSAKWKQIVYYAWYESLDETAKLYLQYRTVKYADYKIGMCYIAPSELQWDGSKLREV